MEFPVKNLVERESAIHQKLCPTCGAKLVMIDNEFTDEFWDYTCSADSSHYDTRGGNTGGLENYLKETYPDILAEYERSQKSFDELFSPGDLVEYLGTDIHGKVFVCWTRCYVGKVYKGDSSGRGSVWGDNYYKFSGYFDKKEDERLIEIESDWWKILRPAGGK